MRIHRASKGDRRMLEKALISQYARVASVKSAIIEAVGLLDPAQTNLTPLQSFLLAAIVLDRRPDAIVDLGTGTGCSSATLAIAAGLNGCGIVETFDYTDRWGMEIAPKLLTINRMRWAPIR
jgi:predicted O-methyltransferase YrrM